MRRNESTISTSICQNTCAREKYILRAHKFGGKQGYQIGRFLKSFCNKSSPNIWWRFWKYHFWSQICCCYFLGKIFDKIWPTNYSKIWSHWLVHTNAVPSAQAAKSTCSEAKHISWTQSGINYIEQTNERRDAVVTPAMKHHFCLFRWMDGWVGPPICSSSSGGCFKSSARNVAILQTI